jgi:DNA-binding CsgD family transcriptional regulator
MDDGFSNRHNGLTGGGPDLLLALTPLERSVADLITSGASNREIGRLLFMSHHTVEAHLTRVYAKLGVRSRVQLAVLMTLAGAVGPESGGGPSARGFEAAS